MHSGYTFFISMCVPWELNPQPFVLLMQCSTTEPQKHIYMLKLSGTFMAVSSQTQQDSTKVCNTTLHINSRLLVLLPPLFSAWWPLAPFQNRLYRPTAGSSLSILQQLALLFSAAQQLQEGCTGFEGECGGLLSQTQCANLCVKPPLLVWAAGPTQQRIRRRCLCISLPGTRMTALTDPRTNAKDMLGVFSLDITQQQIV